jgi:hypothetical protein
VDASVMRVAQAWLRFGAWLVVGALTGWAQTATPVALTNPSMEPPYYAVNLDGGAISGYVANGWSDNSSWDGATVQYSEETNDPHSGSACQKMVVTDAGTNRAQFVQAFPLQAGNIYTASVWLRGDPGLQVSLVVQQADSPYATYFQDSIALTAGWQQLTARGYIATTEPALLMVAVGTPGTLWMDDFAISYKPGTFVEAPRLGPIPPSFAGMHVANFQYSQLLNSGLEPPYVPLTGSVSITGSTAAQWYDNSSWGVPNPTVVYSEDTSNPHGGTASQKIEVQSVDPSTAAVQFVEELMVIPGQAYTFSAWLRGDTGAQASLILQDAVAPYTIYASQPVTLNTTWQQFSVTGTVGDTGDILLMFHATQPGTFWVDDAAFTNADGTAVSGSVTWPSAAFGTLRLWDSGTTWAALEPVQGEWYWELLDEWVAAAEQHGEHDIMLTLGQTPTWASGDIDAGATAPPADNQYWRDYITAVAQRYQGRIRYYEIWNEPNSWLYYTGTVAELAELTAEAYTILKSVDPDNIVLSPALYSADYLDQLLQAGVAANVDMIAFHFYETPPEAAVADIGSVKLVMESDGVGSMPLWVTEGATGDDATTPDSLAAAYLVRKYLVHLAFGAAGFNWYTWGKATTFCVGTEAGNLRVPTEAASAFATLLDWLHGASVTGASIDASGTWRVDLDLARDSQGIIIWNPDASAEFALPYGWRTVTQQDIFGNSTLLTARTATAGSSPVLLFHRQREREF